MTTGPTRPQRAAPLASARACVVPCLVLRLPHLHLDELVVGQRRVDRLDTAVVETALPDLNYRPQRMRVRTQLAAVAGGQWQSRHWRTVTEDREQVQRRVKADSDCAGSSGYRHRRAADNGGQPPIGNL